MSTSKTPASGASGTPGASAGPASAAPARLPMPPRRGPMGGGPFGGAGMPTEKPASFWPSAKRLLGRLRPERPLVLAVILLGIVSVVFTVLGPKLLGQATNIIFEGF